MTAPFIKHLNKWYFYYNGEYYIAKFVYYLVITVKFDEVELSKEYLRKGE